MHLKRDCQGRESEESKLDVIRNGGNWQEKGEKSQGTKKIGQKKLSMNYWKIQEAIL